MEARTEVTIEAPRAVVWDIVVDLDRAADVIAAIEEVEVLERPEAGLVGLKWRETRTLFGKRATETMWVTEAVDHSYYVAEARSHGSIYESRVALRDAPGGGTVLEMGLRAEAQTLGTRIFATLLAPLMRGSVRKAFEKDLQDIKRVAEARAAAGVDRPRSE